MASTRVVKIARGLFSNILNPVRAYSNKLEEAYRYKRKAAKQRTVRTSNLTTAFCLIGDSCIFLPTTTRNGTPNKLLASRDD
jgi:hypothetical protein